MRTASLARWALACALAWGLASPPARSAPEGPGAVPESCQPLTSDVVDVEVETEDGAVVHLHRHPAHGPPVLLVHGLSSNHWSLDLGPDRSLAAHLQARGMDTWALDLRGHGDARRTETAGPQVGGWTLDDYGRYDLHAAIAHIRAETGASELGYVGHSMGGMVAAIYQAWHGDAALGAVVVVGSPIDFGHLDPLVVQSLGAMGVGTLPRRLPGPAVGAAAARLGGAGPLGAFLWTRDSISKEAERRLVARAAGNMSRQELAHLRGAIREGRLVSADGTRDYAASLAELQAPLLVLAGRADHIAPPDRVRPWHDLAGSEDKVFLVAGRANGFTFDHGHVDLVVGDTAPTEIYPLITGFLSTRLDHHSGACAEVR